MPEEMTIDIMGINIKEHMKFTQFLEGQQVLAMAAKGVYSFSPGVPR